jgi:hypothetical protein
MTTIFERMNDALEGLGLPMADNFYKVSSGGSLPNEFMLYFEIISISGQHADDVEKSRHYHMQISYFNIAGLQSMPDIAGAMMTEGFTKGPTRELPYNQETGHYGYALEFWYYEEE